MKIKILFQQLYIVGMRNPSQRSEPAPTGLPCPVLWTTPGAEQRRSQEMFLQTCFSPGSATDQPKHWGGTRKNRLSAKIN